MEKKSIDYKVLEEMNKVDIFLSNSFYQKFIKTYNLKHKKSFFTEFDQENYYQNRSEVLKRFKSRHFENYVKQKNGYKKN